MVVVQSFPFLNLPLLPLKEVINQMCLIDKLWLSSVSRKTKDLVKQNTICHLEVGSQDWWSVYKIACKYQNGSEVLNIDICNSNDQGKDCFNREVYGLTVPVKLMKDSLKTFWEDQSEGFWKMISVLCNAFKIKNFTIRFQPTNKEKLYKIVSNIQRLKSEFNANVSKIEIYGLSLDDNTYKDILEKFNDVPELIFSVRDNIRYRHCIDRSESSCEINYANWLTLRNLDFCEKYNSIKLYWSDLTIQEVNLFLKKWLESSTMKTIELTTQDVDIELAVKGLPVTPQQKHISCCGTLHVYAKCYEIRRNDGVKAHFWKYHDSFAMQTYK